MVNIFKYASVMCRTLVWEGSSLISKDLMEVGRKGWMGSDWQFSMGQVSR